MASSNIRFFDPHFHLWDMTLEKEEDGNKDLSTMMTTVSGHDKNSLFPPNLYGKVEYEAEVTGGGDGGGGGSVFNHYDTVQVVHEGGVCIEVNSINFVDQSGEELISKYQKELNVVGIKISMLSRIDPKSWDIIPIVIEAIHRTIKLFGVQRVAFASNAPVDAHNNDEDASLSWPASRVLAAFDRITASAYTTTERSWLFADAAKRMYRCS